MLISHKDIKNAYPAIMRFANSYNRKQTQKLNKEDLEDLVQDTILRLLKSKMDRMDISSFIGLCIQNFKWTVGDYYRKNKYKNDEKNVDIDELQTSSFLEEDKSNSDLSWNEQSTLTKLSSENSNQEANILNNECWEKLTDQKREVLLLNSIERYTTASISKLLQKPQGTICDWLAQAKLEFMNCMKGVEV